MPIKLNVGLSRKVGQPQYGSRGASVNLETELESAAAGEPQRLHEAIRRLFELARQSIDDELGQNHQQYGPPSPAGGNGASSSQPHPRQQGARTNLRPATQSQVRAIYAITSRRKIDLAELLQQRFGHHRPQDLSLDEASNLIDELNGTYASDGNGASRPSRSQ